MKTLKLFVIVMGLFLAGSTVQAQVSVRFNIGSPPMWGPDGHSDVRYYYLPDVECYYDIQSSRFIYFNGRDWVYRSSLPTRYRNYDLYDGYKVPMTGYHGRTPYNNFGNDKIKYSKGYRGESQRTIGERPGHGKRHYSEKRYQNDQPNRNYNQHDSRNDRYDNDRNKKKENNHGRGNGE